MRNMNITSIDFDGAKIVGIQKNNQKESLEIFVKQPGESGLLHIKFHGYKEEKTELYIKEGINFARAPIEILLTEIKKEAIPESMQSLAEAASKKVRCFSVIEDMRLSKGSMSVSGPLKLKTGAQFGSFAAGHFDPKKGVQSTAHRNASIKSDRRLQINGLSVFDEVSQNFVNVFEAMDAYLTDIKAFVKEYYPNIHWIKC
jgi:hypothetical protein